MPLTRAELKRRLERPYRARFWGAEHLVQPCLVSEIFGDGRMLIFVTPIATRPHHYLVRVDSRTGLSGAAWRCEQLDEVLDSIAEEFGDDDDEEFGDPDETGWPRLIASFGVSWGKLRWEHFAGLDGGPWRDLEASNAAP